MNNFLMVILTSLPDDIQGFWNMDILGYTTIGTIATAIGGFAYTLIRGSIQRKAVAKGLENTSKREDARYKEFLEYKIQTENRIAELEEDNYTLAQANFRKEAKQVAEKYVKRKQNQQKAKELFEKASNSPIVQTIVEEVKKKFR